MNSFLPSCSLHGRSLLNPPCRSCASLELLHAKKSNKGSSSKGSGGGGGGGGFGNKDGINKKNDAPKRSSAKNDDGDYAAFPPLEPNILKTLIESSREDSEHAKDLSVEMYQRLDQIYGFPDFNFPPGWFDDDDDVSVSSGGSSSSGVSGKSGSSETQKNTADNPSSSSSSSSSSWQDLLKPKKTETTEPLWMASESVTDTSVVAASASNHLEDIQEKDGIMKDKILDEIQNLPPFTKFRVLHVDPMVLAIDDFFTDEECQEYVEMCSSDVTDSNSRGNGNDKGDADKVVASSLSTRSKTVGKDSRSMAQRTSTTWFHHYRAVPAVMAKASRLMGLRSIDRWEEPQTVRYRQTEKFTWHLDALAPSDDLIRKGGQRVATLLVYLTDVGENNGGSTVFRDLRGSMSSSMSGSSSSSNRSDSSDLDPGDHHGQDTYLKMIPKKGSALLFFPAAGGVPNTPFDIRTLHAGEALAPDAPTDKWISQLWLRENDLYQPSAPPGNSRDLASKAIRDYCRDWNSHE